MKTQTILTTTLLTKTLATTTIVGLLTFASVAQAGPHCGDKGEHAKHGQMSDGTKAEHMQKHLDRMAAKLGLSDEQSTQVQALMQNSRNEIKPLRNEKRALHQEIRQLDPKASDYSAKLADAANRQAEITRQMTISRGNRHQQMAKILTPEQLAKQKEMRAERKGGFHKRMNRKQQQS